MHGTWLSFSVHALLLLLLRVRIASRESKRRAFIFFSGECGIQHGILCGESNNRSPDRRQYISDHKRSVHIFAGGVTGLSFLGSEFEDKGRSKEAQPAFEASVSVACRLGPSGGGVHGTTQNSGAGLQHCPDSPQIRLFSGSTGPPHIGLFGAAFAPKQVCLAAESGANGFVLTFTSGANEFVRRRTAPNDSTAPRELGLSTAHIHRE